ncbi:MAG: chemotaxis protein CheC [Fimbriimonadia bacterium]|jgi:chemotaxis protein CheC
MPAQSLSDTELDVLREVTNIGLGNAITTLADMTKRKFLMSVPDVQAVGLAEVPGFFGSDQAILALYMPVSGALDGHVALMLRWDSAGELWDMLLGSHPENVWQMDEMYASAALEVGNIVLSSFLNAIGCLASGTCHASPPYLAVDRAEVLLESIVSQAWAEQSEVLALNTDFREEGRAATGYFLYIPSEGSLESLFRALGVRKEAA